MVCSEVAGWLGYNGVARPRLKVSNLPFKGSESIWLWKSSGSFDYPPVYWSTVRDAKHPRYIFPKLQKALGNSRLEITKQPREFYAGFVA